MRLRRGGGSLSGECDCVSSAGFEETRQARWRAGVMLTRSIGPSRSAFFIEHKNERLYIPSLKPSPKVNLLNLPAERTVDYARCDNAYFDQFIGPEEPKLFFTPEGAPLLMYSQPGSTPGICRGPAIIDARVLFPKLGPALKKVGYDAPLEFADQTREWALLANQKLNRSTHG